MENRYRITVKYIQDGMEREDDYIEYSPLDREEFNREIVERTKGPQWKQLSFITVTYLGTNTEKYFN